MEWDSNNNLEDRDLNEIKAVTIDVPSSLLLTLNDENFKVFFILLKLIEKDGEMATALADRLFTHFVFTIGKILSKGISNTIDLDLFAYIITT